MGLLLPHCFLDQFLGLEVCRKVLLCQTKEASKKDHSGKKGEAVEGGLLRHILFPKSNHVM